MEQLKPKVELIDPSWNYMSRTPNRGPHIDNIVQGIAEILKNFDYLLKIGVKVFFIYATNLFYE